MGKTGKAAKRRRLAELESSYATTSSTSSHSSSTPGSGPSSPPTSLDFLQGLISPSELATTVRTLQTLTKNTELLKSKGELKSLRGAVFDFVRVGNEQSGTGNTLTSRISAALSSSRHEDALVLLAEMRLRKLSPKLGALQRWVRDCDAASRSDGSFGDEEVLRVLDAILRTTMQEEEADVEGGEMGKGKGKSVVRKMEEWKVREGSGVRIWDEINGGLFPLPEARDGLAKSFRLVEETPGPLRLPPNHHPALLFTSLPSTIPLSLSPATPTKRHEVPHVPGAFLLSDVLSLEECRSILGHSESVGFKPDKPVGEEGASVLAHNLYWLADEGFLDDFWKRFVHLLPQEVAGGKVMGLNARFRVYRYVPGAIYRPHVDGAWPKSGLDPVTGEYLYDSSPPAAPQWSRLTFLIYLNDEFPAGHTTFFLPSPSQEGTLEAYPIKPTAGCALVFPHGECKGSLLHEGSPVGESGAKYVIRTDVLYEVGKSGKGDQGLEV